MKLPVRTSLRLSRFLFLVPLLVVAAPLHAASISYNTTFGPSGIPFSPTAYSLPKFDSALGTLTEVILQLEATTSAGSITFDNESGVSTAVTLGIGATVTANAPSAVAITVVPVQSGSTPVGSPVGADDDLDPDFIGADSFTVTGGVGADSDSDSSTDALVLAAYTAAFPGETFDTLIDAVLYTNLSASGGFGPLDATAGITSGVITVTYNYVAVPEPASVVLGALGVCALGLVAYRRRRAA
jgi:hypothetical protein